ELSSRNTTPELETPVSFAKEPSPPASRDEDTPGTVEVLDASGLVIGRVRRLKTDHYLVDRVMKRPIRRQVQIRLGRKFTAEDIELAHRPPPGDARAFKWLSFYVQATGELQERPCQGCSLNHGPYHGCVLIKSDEFPRCGNCEWNRRGC